MPSSLRVPQSPKGGTAPWYNCQEVKVSQCAHCTLLWVAVRCARLRACVASVSWCGALRAASRGAAAAECSTNAVQVGRQQQRNQNGTSAACSHCTPERAVMPANNPLSTHPPQQGLDPGSGQPDVARTRSSRTLTDSRHDCTGAYDDCSPDGNLPLSSFAAAAAAVPAEPPLRSRPTTPLPRPSPSPNPQSPQSPSMPYINVPPPPSKREPLWSEQEAPAPVDPGRQIFCNRSLNMKHIKAIGWDLDYTVRSELGSSGTLQASTLCLNFLLIRCALIVCTTLPFFRLLSTSPRLLRSWPTGGGHHQLATASTTAAD